MSENKEISDDIMSALLDANLDEIADLPEFKAFPEGVHKCFLDITVKSIGEGEKRKVGFDFGLKYIEPVELADVTAEPPKAGDGCNQFCDMANEYGAGTFKLLTVPIATHFGIDTKSPTARREILEKAKNLEVQVVTKIRKGKTGTPSADAQYLSIKELTVL